MKNKIKIISLLSLFILVTSNISEICERSEDCNLNNYCYEQRCHHKSIFPISLRDTVGFLTIIVGSALSNAGGIGGGGLFIPVLIIIMEFYTHEAIPISKLMIFAGSLTTFFLNQKLHHPSRDSICLDYNISILFVPMLLLGTVIGVSLNKVMPSFIILILLTLVLLVNTYKTTVKAVQLFKYENDEKLIKVEKNDKKNIHNSDRERNFESWDSNERIHPIDNGKTDLNSNLVRIEIKKDQSLCQWNKIRFLFFSYMGILLLSFIRGSFYFKSIIGVETCSASYWLIYFLFIPFTLLITFFIIRHVKRETEYRLSIGFPFDQHDIIWRGCILYKFPIHAFLAGLTAGLVGIGGGLIIGPLLIGLGVNPVISTVTSNFLVLFTSSSTSIQFSLIGMMNIDYGGICTVFSIIGSLIGTVTVHYILLITKRESVLVLILSFVLLLSTILLPGYSIYDSLSRFTNVKDLWDFNSPC